MKRLEDPRLIRGQAQYVDDLQLAGLMGSSCARPMRHARIVRIDTSEAGKQPGVYSVRTARELRGAMKPKALILAPPNVVHPGRLALAGDRVRFVGDPVAFVVAADRATATDAADLVQVEYDPLRPVVDPEAAPQPGAPLVYSEAPGNVAYEHAWSTGDVAGAFARAHRIVRCRFLNQRLAALPLEPRGCVALWQAGALTFWTSTQGAHKTRSLLAETLGVPEHAIRVIAPEVGQPDGLCGTQSRPAALVRAGPHGDTDASQPLGAKGVGEAGCVGAPQAVVNAVIDALQPFGVTHIDMPLRPEKLWRRMHNAEAR